MLLARYGKEALAWRRDRDMAVVISGLTPISILDRLLDRETDAMFRVSVLIVALALVAACDSTSSNQVSTDAMRLLGTVAVDDAGLADVTVQLTIDNPALLERTWVALDPADLLAATVAERRRELIEEQPVLGLYQYRRSFEGVVPGDVVEIAFEREHAVSAFDTRVEVPAPVALAAMPASFSRRDGLVVRWTPVDADGRAVWARGSCIEDAYQVVSGDPGQLALDAGFFRHMAGTDEACDVTIEVTVWREGVVDGRFESGRLRAERSASAVARAEP